MCTLHHPRTSVYNVPPVAIFQHLQHLHLQRHAYQPHDSTSSRNNTSNTNNHSNWHPLRTSSIASVPTIIGLNLSGNNDLLSRLNRLSRLSHLRRLVDREISRQRAVLPPLNLCVI